MAVIVSGNPVEKNNAINLREIEARQRKLDSTPKYITIGAHYACNANCVFCLGGDFSPFSLARYKEFFEIKLCLVLQKATNVGFCGFGEVLLMPEILDFLDYINEKLPLQCKTFTTNGTPLHKDICDKFGEGNYAILISLHAANRELHQHLTKLKNFDLIIENIKRLVDVKRKRNPKMEINLIFLLTTLNIDNLPDFVKLGHELGVNKVTCSYLTIFLPKHIRMSCFFEKEKTNAIFDRAEEIAGKLGVTLLLPPRFGNRDEKISCRDPWEFFYVENQGSVLPCCFAGEHIGYLNKQEFEEIWNGKGYLELREGLITENPHAWCRHCYKYKPSNVNDIGSHINFRPNTRRKIIEYLEKNKGEFGNVK